MNKTKNQSTPNRKPAFITMEAHQHLPVLCEILAEEKGLSRVDYIDAISNAVIADARRAARRRERRQQADLARA